MSTPHTTNDASSFSVAVPPMKQGDRLTRDEFERRFEAMPQVKKAELIEGVVHMPAAVRFGCQGRPHAHLISWLVNYEAATPGILVADNTSVRIDPRNEPQPDAALLIDPARGGQAGISQDDYIEGAPELVAEITSSRADFDLGEKLKLYRSNGVREYIVWRALDEAIDWFVLKEGQYEELVGDEAGIVRSETFPGLWLDRSALIAGDLNQVFSVLQQGLADEQHAAFVDRLVE